MFRKLLKGLTSVAWLGFCGDIQGKTIYFNSNLPTFLLPSLFLFKFFVFLKKFFVLI